MPRETLKYTNEKVTVVWKPKLCTHSAICFKGLPQVFDPKARPWVNINGDEAERIIEQVRRCPSGALSLEDKEEPTPLNTEVGSKEPTAPLPLIQLLQSGPMLVKGPCVVQFPNGHEEVIKGSIALCRCGASGNKPYCDGSHRKNNFQDAG